MVIDITGNWRGKDGHAKQIQVREPEIADGQSFVFEQSLRLTVGRYVVEFVYDPNLDKAYGHALGGVFEGFAGFSINAMPQTLTFAQRELDGGPYFARCAFTVDTDARDVALRLALHNTRPMQTRLAAAQPAPSSSRFFAVPSRLESRPIVAHGIPFLVRGVESWIQPWLWRDQDHKALAKWGEVHSYPVEIEDPATLGMQFFTFGARVETAHFLGMIHNIDIANGSWYSPKGDHGFSHFVGDKAGEIIVVWTEGGHTVIPLIFGFNLWYGHPWDLTWHNSECSDPGGANWDARLFEGRDEYRDCIRDAVRLVDGVRFMGAKSNNARFIFSVDFEGRAVEQLLFRGVPELYDFPLISAITFETETPAANLPALPDIAADSPNVQPVSLGNIEGEAHLLDVECIMCALYTFVDDLPVLTTPEVPAGYFGPEYDFQGAPEAVYAATYLYRNGPESAAHIADTGSGCSSPVSSGCLMGGYKMGMGTWRRNETPFADLAEWLRLYQERKPGDMPLCGAGWTRGVGQLLREAVAFGYDKFTETYLDWLDGCLFDEATPPHWNRIAGNRSFYEACVAQAGDVVERGNRENDGHGNCMWGRYMAWHAKGRPRDWNEKRWRATEAAVEWVQFQLDKNPDYPGTKRDILFTCSECGAFDIYGSYSCLHGVKLSIRMAEQLGKTETVARWQALYNRLRQGILTHLVEPSPEGPVWHTEPGCDWQDHAHKLVPIHLATEGDTYTPLDDYAKGDADQRRALDISRNAYRQLMRDKNYDCLRMYGYGQGMMTQTALLLDEMHDAEQFLSMLLRHCYLPEFAGWASPEGIVVHRSGKYYLPVNGYAGQDSHLADSVKAVRLTLGIDDNDPAHTRLVPRFPGAWTRMYVRRMPVVTGSARGFCDYAYERSDNVHRFTYRFDEPPTRLSLRLGPVPIDRAMASAEVSGLKASVRPCESGDSRWVWFQDIPAANGEVILRLDC